jgi:GH18 family chitinase
MQMNVAKVMGIDVILSIGTYGDGKFFKQLSNDNVKISQFVNFLLDTLKQFSADGIYLTWTWPGCPTVLASNFHKNRPVKFIHLGWNFVFTITKSKNVVR